MKDDEIAALGLPRALRSPWRWFLYAIGAVLVLTGMSGFVVGVEDAADLVVSLVMVVLGVAVPYLSLAFGCGGEREVCRRTRGVRKVGTHGMERHR